MTALALRYLWGRWAPGPGTHHSYDRAPAQRNHWHTQPQSLRSKGPGQLPMHCNFGAAVDFTDSTLGLQKQQVRARANYLETSQINIADPGGREPEEGGRARADAAN